MLIEVLGRNSAAARNGERDGGDVECGAQIDDRDLPASVEHPLDLLGRDSRDPQSPEKQPATELLERDIPRERRSGERDGAVAEGGDSARDVEQNESEA